MIRKTLLIIVLAAFAAFAAEALSQGPGGASASSPAPAKTPPAAVKNAPTKSSAPIKSGSPGAKEASPDRTFPTSSGFSAPSPGSSAFSKKELIVHRALVTLIDDNKVPATETGMLTDIPAKEGQSVEKGALVAEIDSRSTLAKQRIAEAEHAGAEAQAKNDAEVVVAQNAIEVSKADLDANDEIRRINPRAVSDAEHRKYKFTYQKSLAQLKQAENEKEIARLTANAKKAQYDAASIELDLRQIRAPFNGLVVEVIKNRGDWVTAGEPIMHIVGLDRLKVRGHVFVTEEDSVSHIDVINKPVTITVDSPGGRKHTVKGFINFASPVIEGYGNDRQFRITAEVDNEKLVDPVTGQESWKIQPGSMATMTIDLSAKPTAAAKSFKPVTAEAEKSDSKKRSRKER